MSKCFMCGLENDDKLERSSLPKELIEPNEAGDLAEDFKTICDKCNEFRKIVDSHFVTFCEDAKLWEWYRSNSKRSGEYFPPEFVYNVPIERLLELYYLMLDIAETANVVSSNDVHRQELRDDFNYAWRKKDE